MQTRSHYITGLLLAVALLLSGCKKSGPESLAQGKKYLEKKDYSRAMIELRNAAQKMPKDADTIYHLGLAFMGSGDVQNGVRCFRAAAEINPKHAEAQLRLAELMSMNSNEVVVKEAERRAQLAMTAASNNMDAVTTLAFTELRLGKMESAEHRLQEILDKSPSNLRAAVVMANVKLNQKDAAGAEKVLRTAVDQSPKVAASWLALARFYLMTGRVKEGEEAENKALAIEPDNVLALQDLGAIYRRGQRKPELEAVVKKLTNHPSKKFPEAWSLYLYSDGRRKEAIEEMEKVRKDYPKNRTFRGQVVAMYLAEQRIADAEKVLTQALEYNPKDVEALVQRGQVYLLGGRLENLEKDMNLVLKYKPDSGEAHYLLARVQRMKNSPQNERRELYEALKQNTKLLAARLDLAQMLTNTGSPKSSLELLDAAPDDQRNTLPVVIQRNWALMASQQWPVAKDHIRKALDQAKVPELLLQQGIAYVQDKQYVQARGSLEQGLQLAPKDIRLLQMLAQTHALETKNTDSAVAAVERRVKADPGNAQLQHLYGNWLVAAGKVAPAKEAYQAAAKADPKYKGASFSLAQVDIASGDIEGARKVLNGLLATDANDSGANVLLGMVEDMGNHKDQAIAAYRKVLINDPTNVVALNNLAYRLSTEPTGLDEALRFAQKAKEAAPQQSSVDDTLGWIYYQKGLYWNAIRHLELATAIKEPPPVRYYHLAMAYQKGGNQKRAKETFLMAQKAAPQLPEAQMAKQVLGIN